jgi:Icc-related predicted phosphoesterase
MLIIRVLTVADIHQSKVLYDQLLVAIKRHRPKVLAFVGDFLNAFDMAENLDQFSTEEWALRLSELAAEQIVFVRGNHEQENWMSFIYSWRFESHQLASLYGTVMKVGPLGILGFPCNTGWEEPWCESLPKEGNEIILDPAKTGRKCLPADVVKWLPKKLLNLGSFGQHLWLMHEPPVQRPLGDRQTWNPQWMIGVKRFGPLITVSGHDHEAPLIHRAWHCQIGKTLAINVGQTSGRLHYCVLEFEFDETGSSMPSRVKVSSHPWGETIEL